MQQGFLLTAVDFVSESDTYMIPSLIGSSVDVVGTTDSQRGCQCDKHYVCVEALVIGSHVCFRKARFSWREGVVEDVLEVNSLFDGKDCKVGY